MACKYVTDEPVFKHQVEKEKSAAKSWEFRYGFLREEAKKAKKEIEDALEPLSETQDHRVVVTLPANTVPVPQQTSQMIGWRSGQTKFHYDLVRGQFRRRKPVDSYQCFCRVGYDCICLPNEGPRDFLGRQEDID